MASNAATLADSRYRQWNYPNAATKPIQGDLGVLERQAASMTKVASKQTYYTIRWLADRERTANAYRAYAYFRWLDDLLDEGSPASDKGLALVERQQALVEGAYRDELADDLLPEEQLLADLIRTDREADSGLQTYLRHMLAVIAFDVHRRGQVISQQDLDGYTRHLTIAVTEVLHYAIGHGAFAPRDETRYLAVAGAHIAHMLRDTYEDIAVAYYNIPREYLDAHGIAPWEGQSLAYRDWVKGRVALARDDFRIGKAYLAQVESYRARLAGYAYVARFERVLDAIECDGYQLRPEYRERNNLRAGLRMGWSVLTLMLKDKLLRAGTPSPIGVGKPMPNQ
jgi:squalene/phytoene synthase